ncbi:putative RNA polymerase II subunit B1 CTD phosphatase RPAP2 [Trichoplax sp. H2]|nr:putative RNA polymerase II subunit B1 CTD phosphatase RPAP2 [Trichoplax sp. H2]|eukprot:RDD45385.1 putative RNA polymerase II subunit B1 CTD phosphatase RPAP2 [Trichoplax sp. H2]
MDDLGNPQQIHGIELDKSPNKDESQGKTREIKIGHPSGHHQRKAMNIVEQLLDTVSQEFLLNCAKFIDPSYYDDAIEERFIIRKCGYPICENQLQNVTRQKYHIDTARNKVYDMEKKRRFCSNFCCKASNFFAKQLSTEPLWGRHEIKNKIVLLQHLSSDEQSSAKLPADDHEITLITNNVDLLKINDEAKPDLGSHNSYKLSRQSNNKIKESTSIKEDFERSKIKLTQTDNKRELDATLLMHHDSPSPYSSSKNISPIVNIKETKLKEDLFADDIPSVDVDHAFNHQYQSFHSNSKLKNTFDPCRTLPVMQPTVVVPQKTDPYAKIIHVLQEWSTTETKNFLMPADLNNPNCDSKTETTVHIAKDSWKIDDTRDCRPELSKNGSHDRSISKENLAEPERQETDVYLPLHSSNYQASLRRNIILDRIKKGLREPLSSLNLIYCDIRQDMTDLIRTFRLSRDNISLNHKQWKLLAVILITILSFKNSIIGAHLKSRQENYNQLLRNLDTNEEQILQFSSILHQR